MEIELSQDEKDEHNRIRLMLDAAIAYKDPDPESNERAKRISHAKRMLAGLQTKMLVQGRTKIDWIFNPSLEH